MRLGVKDMKREYKKVNIDSIEVRRSAVLLEAGLMFFVE